MNGANKILTVSYGTFSCTLEGFDDPFNTMKAIAEYFRDLAAEDRYFGAEPPQPDAAMLHRIAEREVQRRVEAKIQENGVILRADTVEAAVRAPAPAPAPAPVPAPAPAPASAAAPVVSPGPVVAEANEAISASVAEKLSRLRQATAASAPVAATAVAVTSIFPEEDDYYTEDEQSEPSPAFTEALGVNAELAEDIAEASEDAPQMAEEAADIADVLPEDLAADRAVDVEAETAPAALDTCAPTGDDLDLAPDEATAAEISLPDAIAPEARDLDAEAAEPAQEHAADLGSLTEDAAKKAATAPTLKEMAAEEAILAGLAKLVEPEAKPDVVAPIEPAPEADILGELDTIRAVLGDDMAQAPEADLPEEILTSSEGIEDSLAAENAPEADSHELIAEEAALDDMPAMPEAFAWSDAEAEEAEDMLAEVPPRDDRRAPEADAPAIAEHEETDFGTDAAPSSDDLAEAPEVEAGVVQPIRPVRPVRPVRPARPLAGATTGRPVMPVAGTPPDTDAQETRATPATPSEPVTIERLQRARARLIRIRRSEAMAGTEEDDTANLASPDIAAETASPALSDDAEAALRAELSALESKTTSKAESEATIQRRDRQAAEALRRLAPEGDDAVNRLMAEASSQMEGPETRRRQSAIAHLKAAVAATLAERRIGGARKAKAAEREDAYREDLSRVVGPTPQSGATETAPVRPTPLVLVSEQRIDRPAAPTPMVTPPRATTATAPLILGDEDAYEDDIADDGTDTDNIFGATTSFVEFADRLGATTLQETIEAAAAYIACIEGRDSFTRPQLLAHVKASYDDVQREDSLRSFGILLREGRIEKNRRGQFAISETSPFLAEARRIAG